MFGSRDRQNSMASVSHVEFRSVLLRVKHSGRHLFIAVNKKYLSFVFVL